MHCFTSFWKWMAYLTTRPLWPCILTKFSTIYTHFGHVLYNPYVMIYICSGTVFSMGIQWWCLFSRQTNQFWKFPYLTYVHMIYTLFFNRIQWSPWFCNHEGVCEHTTWYGYDLLFNFHFAFNQNGYFVIRDHITIIYDMGIIKMHFSIYIHI